MANTSIGYYYADTGTGTPASPTAISGDEASAAQAVYDDTIAPGLVPRVASSIERDALYPSPVQGDQVRRNDLGYVEQYFDTYNAISNPGGASPSGWYPVTAGAWVDFTPSFASGSIGSGTIEHARYFVTGPECVVSMELVLGAGFNATDFVLNLPYGTITFGDSLMPLGPAMLVDDSAGVSGRLLGVVYSLSSSTVRIARQSTDNGQTAVTSSTTPFTWASGDSILAYFRYPIA